MFALCDIAYFTPPLDTVDTQNNYDQLRVKHEIPWQAGVNNASPSLVSLEKVEERFNMP